MLSLNIQISGNASETLKNLKARLQLPGLKKQIGQSLAEHWRKYLRTKDAREPNRLGGKRTHYYRKAADTISYSNRGNTIQLTATHPGLALRYYGGTIRPKRAKLLTIPIHPKAHGERAEKFDLTLIKSGKGRGATLLLAKTGSPEKPTPPQIYYILSPKATHHPDPTIAPDSTDLHKTVKDTLQTYLNQK